MTEIKYIGTPNSEEEIYSVLHPLVLEWFKKNNRLFQRRDKSHFPDT